MPKNCYSHMRVEERETLSFGLAQGQSLRGMATVLGRVPSPVSCDHTPTRGATRIGPARHRVWWRSGRVSHGDRANSWTPDCGGTSGHTWSEAARPNRLPTASRRWPAALLPATGTVT